ncbi:MAG: GNAT family N-acetyltransferase, partial [Caulobacterales bacterium]|nr:GNAT family N-acetyltransferase [Caulobacterales bacterium]
MIRIDPLSLEILTQEAFPPLETARLGDWRLTASLGQAVRINSCWPLGAADRALPEAVGAVEAWYAARNLPSQF